VKNLINNFCLVILLALLASCARDRDYIENIYRNKQVSQDIYINRETLYKQSFVGVHKEIKDEE